MQLFIQEDLCFQVQPSAALAQHIQQLALTKANPDGFVILSQRITQPEAAVCAWLAAVHQLALQQSPTMTLQLKHWDQEVSVEQQFSQLYMRLYCKQSQWRPFKLERGHFPVDDRQVRVKRENGEEGVAQFIYAEEVVEEHVGYWLQYVHPSAIQEIDLLSDVVAWQYFD